MSTIQSYYKHLQPAERNQNKETEDKVWVCCEEAWDHGICLFYC